MQPLSLEVEKQKKLAAKAISDLRAAKCRNCFMMFILSNPLTAVAPKDDGKAKEVLSLQKSLEATVRNRSIYLLDHDSLLGRKSCQSSTSAEQ